VAPPAPLSSVAVPTQSHGFGAPGWSARGTTRYTYDALSRLTEAATTGSTSFTWSYMYDNASNRIRRTKGSDVVSYAYNDANELCWKHASAITSPSRSDTRSGRTTYSYDANGDLTSSSDGLAATYNVAKQKTDYKPNTAGSTTTFEYAGQGQKERTKKNSGLYLDSVLGVSAEKPGSNYRGYVRDNSGALVGTRNPEGSPVAKKRYYYLRDALGSVVAVTNDQGTVVRRHVYGDPYGEDVSNDEIVTGALSNSYRFAGEYLDTETSLYKIGERYYDPALARWTQKDPMMQAFSPRETNGYSYVGGDPVNVIDPSGTRIIYHECASLSWEPCMEYVPDAPSCYAILATYWLDYTTCTDFETDVPTPGLPQPDIGYPQHPVPVERSLPRLSPPFRLPLPFP
jgi:RHS repeat-associated protein